jgi:microcystin-dependent protein
MAQHETPQWLLPYPDEDETANVPRDLQALAQAADQAISATGESSGVPVGAIVMFASDAEPARFMRCDGTALSRVDFAELFAVIGTKFGSGDGSTTFNLPNLRARFPVGINDAAIVGPPALSVRQINGKGGVETHKLTAGQLARHSHKLPDAGNFLDNPSSGGFGFISYSVSNPGGSTIRVQGWSATDSDGGSDQAHENMPPFLVVNFVIKYTAL